MKGLRATLQRFLSRASDAVPTARLPEEILDHLTQRNAQPLQDWLQKRLKANPDTQEFPLLLRKAKKLGWPEPDVEKLAILGVYYRGEIREAFQRAVKFTRGDAFDPDLFLIATLALYHLGQFEDAYRLLKSAGEREDLLLNRSDYSITAALTCNSANHLDEMKLYIDAAWRLAADDPVIAFNAYIMYFELGDMDAFAEVALRIRENRYPPDKFGLTLAAVELAQDRYAEGFRFLEWRYGMDEANRLLNPGLFDRPRWQEQKEPLTGKVLLVSAEQGLGDTIQMARYFHEPLRLGAARVIVEAQPETLSLLRFNFPGIGWVERKYPEAPSVDFDLWAGSMSLPHLLGATTENILGRAGYLRVPPENTGYWRDRVAELARGDRPRIGLAWSGQPLHRDDRRRSIPFLRMMDVIRDIDADFFALQTHVPPVRPANLIDVSEELITLADTAALIAEMDWVITVDTSVVHLAGALSKETWLLLPYRYEWRWSLEGESNHWYDSVSVLRQKTHGDWDALLHEVFDHRLPERLSAQKEA